MSKKKADPAPPPAAPFHNPFGGLADKLGIAPAPPPAPAPKSPAARPPPARAVVRLERKGRGGKEVTVVEKLELSLRERDAWLSDAKRALGCGGVVDGDALVLQGDLRERVRDWLVARGVKKVTVG